MDRRQFLSTVSALGSSGAFASSLATLERATSAFIPATDNAHDADGIAACSGDSESYPKVGIIAIGSAGGWVLNRLNGKLPQLARTVAVDTSGFLMHRVSADRTILLGRGSRKNEGSVAPCVLAESAAGKIASSIEGINQLFILTDMVSATEQEVASLVAIIAQRAQVMTICAVTRPLSHGVRKAAQDWSSSLAQRGVPTVVLVGKGRGNAEGMSPEIEVVTAFERLYRCTVMIQDVHGQSLVSLDREDIQAAMHCQNEHPTLAIGYGLAEGFDSRRLAVCKAITNPLFDAAKASHDTRLLVSIEASQERLKWGDLSQTLNAVREGFPDSLILFGAFYNPSLGDKFQVTVVAPWHCSG